jgi:exopolysaccharide production protein ExoZ
MFLLRGSFRVSAGWFAEALGPDCVCVARGHRSRAARAGMGFYGYAGRADCPFKVPSAAFAGGLLVPTLARRAPIGLSVVRVAACLLFWPATTSAQYWAASATATLLVLDVSRLRASAPAPGIATLGDWSYALYLCHLPAFVLALKLASDAPLFAGLVGAFGAAALFGTLDVWLYARLKTEMDRSPDESRKRSMLWYLAIFCTAMPAALIIP